MACIALRLKHVPYALIPLLIRSLATAKTRRPLGLCLIATSNLFSSSPPQTRIPQSEWRYRVRRRCRTESPIPYRASAAAVDSSMGGGTTTVQSIMAATETCHVRDFELVPIAALLLVVLEEMSLFISWCPAGRHVPAAAAPSHLQFRRRAARPRVGWRQTLRSAPTQASPPLPQKSFRRDPAHRAR
jgi:hypothetical protein